jgi:mannose-1-phosphate guanylyltransferase
MPLDTYAVIMAGGIGSRFWPMSRIARPKQFLDILSSGRTLIQSTFDRMVQLATADRILVVTNEDYKDLVQEQLPQIRPQHILAEPVGRNTAPCLMFALRMISSIEPEAVVIATPADHLVTQSGLFVEDLKLAIHQAQAAEWIMTIGIPPTRPETGYGYIQYIKESGSTSLPVFEVKTFTEKPDPEMAEAFLKSGDFLWNSGLLCARSSVLMKAYQKHLTDIYDLFAEISPANYNPDRMKEIYADCRSISIDYGLLEHSEEVHTVPARFDWNDLGTWSSVYPFLPKDFLKNASDGRVVVLNARDNLVKAPAHKLTVLLGVDELIVVDAEDVLLICPRSQEQKLREIVSMLRMDRDRYGHYL